MEKTIEEQVLEDRRSKEAQEIAEEVARRKEVIEAQQLLEAREEQRAKERLLGPLSHQSIYGVATNRVQRMLPQSYPVVYLEFPEEIVEILEEAFGIHPSNRIGLSKTVGTLLKCLMQGDHEARRNARIRGRSVSQTRLVGVPVVIEVALAATTENCAHLVCGWAVEFKSRKAEQNALLTNMEEKG